jgi:hypothetical protein
MICSIHIVCFLLLSIYFAFTFFRFLVLFHLLFSLGGWGAITGEEAERHWMIVSVVLTNVSLFEGAKMYYWAFFVFFFRLQIYNAVNAMSVNFIKFSLEITLNRCLSDYPFPLI